MSRCHRCDADLGELTKPHRCRHGFPCVALHVCKECTSFRQRQKKMFVETDARPFVKWAGGKRQLLPQLIEHLPPFNGRYFEPFVGGGALFFALRPDHATLTDANERLIRTYHAVSDCVDDVIFGLRSYPVEESFFRTLRTKPIDATPSHVEVACWFIYLNKTAFNGIYRVNKKGIFNVPWGKRKNPNVCDEPLLRACSSALVRADIACADFEQAVAPAKKGDLVYFDPPYVPASESANFTSYTENGFGLNDHIRLRDCVARLKKRGVHVMVTNSNTKTVRELYADGFDVRKLKARGSVAASAKSRGQRIDLLIS